jgi:large subunit ribosomal protein L6
MSRLIKKNIQIPDGVTVNIDGEFVVFKGDKGEQRLRVLPRTEVSIVDGSVAVKTDTSEREGRTNSGTMWAIAKNAIIGVKDGFSKTLEIEGVGYRANMEGKTLVLSLGYVNPVKFDPPEDIAIVVEKNVIRVNGISKELVGRVAAEIRSFKKPEPYKGKGIRYKGEVIRRKVGKRAGAATG